MKQIQEQCVRVHLFSTSQQRAVQLPTQQGRKAPRTPGEKRLCCSPDYNGHRAGHSVFKTGVTSVRWQK